MSSDAVLARVLAAMAPGGLKMVFQPVIDLRRGTVAGAEALARFAIEPRRTPDVWFQEAWDVELGVELEVMAITRALASLDSLPAGSHMAVNASPQTLVSPLLDAALSDVPGDRVIVELTEHAQVSDYANVKGAIDRYRERGIRLAIDDAGAGFSSLQHILVLRPDLIKLDRSLTMGIDGDPVRFALAAALVTFAASLDAEICAEGIEKPEELAALQHLGIAYGQGYFLGHPLPLPLAAPPRGVWLCENTASPPRERQAARSVRAPAIRRLMPESTRPGQLCPSTRPSPMILDADRIAVIHESQLLDTPREEAFDRVTRWASALLHAPIALFTVLDHDRQYFTSEVGLPEPYATTRETPISCSLCQYVVMTNGPLIIANTVEHPLTRDNGAVAAFGAVAYMGVPVRTAAGKPVGSLCVIDRQTRVWTQEEERLLGELSASLVTELDARALRRQLSDARFLSDLRQNR
jgi:EAL domain-containing protein (putative c-di-GMP-specific phosphodiesterase class I)